MSSVAIPKRPGHIWIGDRPAPQRWLQSWRDLHPDWPYTLYDNVYLTGRRWRNQPLIAHNVRKRHFEAPRIARQPWISARNLFLRTVLQKHRDAFPTLPLTAQPSEEP